MAQDEFRDVNLMVKIDNFKGRKRCPYCKEMPDEMEWTSLGVRMMCRNPSCNHKYVIFVPIRPEELDLVKKTQELIHAWGKYCLNIKATGA